MGTEILPVILILMCAIPALASIYWAINSKRTLTVRLSVAAITLVSIGAFLEDFFSGLHKAPEGYVEECYGDDPKRNLVRKPLSYSATLDLDQSEWNNLELVLEKFSNENELRLFKDIRDDPPLNMFNVSICSSEGLYIIAHKYIWRSLDAEPHIPIPLTISVSIYKNDEKWNSIPNQLNKVLIDAWPDDLNTDHEN